MRMPPSRNLTVIAPAEAIMTPSQVSADFADGNAAIVGMIAAAVEELDGPGGWLGRAIGPQTLELTARCFAEITLADGTIRLPCPPVSAITHVKYIDSDGVLQTFSAANYVLAGRILALVPGASWPSGGDYVNAAQIRYVAGYNGTPVTDSGGTGDVPERIKAVVRDLVLAQYASDNADPLLKADKVEGVGEQQFFGSNTVQRLVDETAGRKLAGLRVWE